MTNMNVLDTGILHYINKASLDLMAYFDSRLSDLGFNINTYEWILLTHIIREPGKSQKWYGDNLLKDKTYVMRLIDDLEKKNLLQRMPDKKDRRQNLLYASKDGEKLIKKTLPVLEQEFLSLFSDISKKNMDATVTVLKGLIEKLELKNV